MPSQPDNTFPPEPWHSLLLELDAVATEEVHLQCLGGFVVTVLYGFPRGTSDVDVLSIAPPEQGRELLKAAENGSKLFKKYGVYLQYVGGIAALPYNYDQRLVPMYKDAYKHLKLFAPDPHDLALSKLSRNSPRDREDVLYLSRRVPLDLDLLRERYQELRPLLMGVKENFDANLELWVEMIREDRS